jgi:hypothetical protein
MKHAEYQYLQDTLTGRRARDPEFESKMNVVADPRAEERQRQLDARTPEEREIEQRQYSLRTYGREHMKRYARPIVTDKPLGELGIEGDQIRSDAPQIKAHKADGVVEPCRDANGRLRLQNHSACPIKQVLKVY